MLFWTNWAFSNSLLARVGSRCLSTKEASDWLVHTEWQTASPRPRWLGGSPIIRLKPASESFFTRVTPDWLTALWNWAQPPIDWLHCGTALSWFNLSPWILYLLPYHIHCFGMGYHFCVVCYLKCWKSPRKHYSHRYPPRSVHIGTIGQIQPHSSEFSYCPVSGAGTAFLTEPFCLRLDT